MSGSIRVLHVDDEPDFGSLVADFLEREDDRFDVVSEASAADGLDRIERDPPDCVVSDYDMPGEDGIEFLEAVRERHPDLPFVLFTGKGSEEVASDAISAGATDYLQKGSGTDQYELLANRVRNAVEQYRSQQELARERSRMTFALESTNAAIWTHDVDTGAMEILPEVCPVFDTEIYTFEEFLEQIHPASRSHVAETVRGATDPGESYSVQFRFPGTDGIRWGEMTGRVVDEGGRPFQTGITRDITTQKERKRRFETLTRNLPGMVYRCLNEPRWPMEDVRGDVAEFSGYTAAELEAGETDWGSDVVHPEDQEDVWEQVQSAVERDESFELTYRILTADGETRWVWERGRGVYDPEGELEALEGFITDVTERRQHEAELARVRDRMEFALARTDAVIWELDLETEAMTSYPDPCPVLGGSVDTVAEFYDRVASEHRSRVEQAVREVRATGESRTVEFRSAPGIDTEWVEGRIQPLHDDGEVTELVGLSRDVTAFKRRERRLERQNEQFDELASVVSHDLGSPTRTVKGRLELAAETGDTAHIEDAIAAVDRLDDLRTDLVDMLRSREVVGERTNLDMASVAEGAWERVNAPADATLRVVDTPSIEGDPDATQRLFQNLFSNAVEHSEEPTTVRIGATTDGFYVEDDGPGIDPADREDVFAPGFSTKSGGTGMGMASVRQIVDEHGWDIAITDGEADTGARFEISTGDG